MYLGAVRASKIRWINDVLLSSGVNLNRSETMRSCRLVSHKGQLSREYDGICTGAHSEFELTNWNFDTTTLSNFKTKRKSTLPNDQVIARVESSFCGIKRYPKACIMELMFSSRGLPFTDKAFRNPCRVMPASSAMVEIPLARLTIRRADSKAPVSLSLAYSSKVILR